MFQIGQAIDFVHNRVGIAHRDRSLENVFVHNGESKLGGCGLSVAATLRPIDAVGKMAPEVLVASAEVTTSYDPCAADVWSLGITFFMLLMGSPQGEVASTERAPFRAFCRRSDVRNVLHACSVSGMLCHSAITGRASEKSSSARTSSHNANESS